MCLKSPLKLEACVSACQVGTAYCRVTRSDSGEKAADMSLNRPVCCKVSWMWPNVVQTYQCIQMYDPILCQGADSQLVRGL